jgi:hypothetical protein
MTHRLGFPARFGRPAAAAATIAALGLLLTGCGREDPPQAATSPAEVRGEPIRGEPIAPPPPAAPAVGTSTAGAPENPPGAGNAGQDSAPPPGSAGSTAASGVGAGASAAGGSVTKPTADAGSGSVAAAGAATATSAEGPMVVGFEKLASFQYTLPEGPVDTNTVAASQAASQIPEAIKGLNNRLVSLKGFMLPLKVEKGLVTELLVMRDQSMCCYGTVPRINEWVSVKMVGAGVKPIMDQAVTFVGKFKVGEMYENGYLVGIYALDGEQMTGPLDM